jgi:uncharacterized protein involved in exopolysaccharide biosynthesis
LAESDLAHENQRPYVSDDKIDLRQVFRVLWAGKWLICGITFTAAVLAVIVSFMLPNIYRADVLLVPTEGEGAAGLSALASQAGGLASLVGIDLGNGSKDKITLGLEVLKSRKFISGFIERHDVLVPLMAAKGWSRQADELEIDPDLYDEASGAWVRDVRPPKQATPTFQEAYREFMEEIFSVVRDETSGFVTISVQHFSPYVAKQWADWLVEDINYTIMKQDVGEAEQAIAYLKKQVETTPLADLRTVFSRLIEGQMKTVMLAEVSNEYLLKTIDPAVVPEEKAKPMRVLIVGATVIVSGVFAMFLVLMLEARRTYP